MQIFPNHKYLPMTKEKISLDKACKKIYLLITKKDYSEREAVQFIIDNFKIPYEKTGVKLRKGLQGFYSFQGLWAKYKNYKKENKIAPKKITPESESPKAKIITLLKKGDFKTISELSDHCDTGIGKIKTIVGELKSEGFNIKIKDDSVSIPKSIAKSDRLILNVNKMSTNTHRFGALGDSHLCSRYERLDVLNALYDEYERQKIKVVYNTGNWIDGEARFNTHDIHVHGMDHQIDYFLKNYPQRKGITTYLITGDDHEGWYSQRFGVNVGEIMQMRAERMGRHDLKFIGHMEADIIIKAPKGETMIRVLHPGGGSAYALSYTVQKIVESYTGNEKPDVLLVGHYHKIEYSYVRGVHCIQTGTTMDQSPFMRKKRLAAHLGGWIIELSTDDVGAVTSFKQQAFPFYDNAYYEKWKYLWNKK